MARTLVIVAVVAVALSAVFLREPSEARAAFPGANGKIAFVSDRDGNDEIYVMNSDGSVPTNLTNDPASDRSPKWSPDGTRIAFISDRSGNDDIYVMNADGTGLQNLTDHPAPDRSIAWSPDGSKIVFVSERDDPNPGDCFPCNSEVYVVNSDGTGLTNTSNDEWTSEQPTWAPDGRAIAFTVDPARRDGEQVTSRGMNIYTVGIDGGDVTQLTFLTGALFCCPDWSPDGTTLVTSRVSFGTSVDIYALMVDSGEFTRLADVGYDTGPTWSPNGDRIAFYTAVYDVGEVYAVDPDGRNLTNLTNHPAADGRSQWSPDGTRIVFERSTGGNVEVFSMRSDGSQQRNLSQNAADDRDPDWQPLPTGDVNCAGGVSSIDAALILQAEAGLIDSLPCGQYADVNGDGAVNSLDAALILQYVAGIIGALPP